MPRAKDLRALLELLRDTRADGRDPERWPATSIEHLRRLLPARVGILGVSRDFRPGGRPASVLTVRHGWTSPEQERVWLKYANTPVARTPEFNALINFDGHQITRTRDQLWGRDAWHRSQTFKQVHEPAGLDDSVISICRQAEGPYSLSIWMHRAPGDPPIGRRQWWLLHVVTAELADMLDSLLALPRDDIAALTPRQRQTLQRLLAGDSEKQAAIALGVKRSTLHEHVLALYRHFGVSSRAELLAAFLGRPLPRSLDPTV